MEVSTGKCLSKKHTFLDKQGDTVYVLSAEGVKHNEVHGWKEINLFIVGPEKGPKVTS